MLTTAADCGPPSSGHGHPLLFCHGGPGLWDMFTDLAATLDDVATVVRWDQRGCGCSERRGPHTVARYLADLDAVTAQRTLVIFSVMA